MERMAKEEKKEKTMDITLLKDGIFVMIIGMGTVFIFLSIMIVAMNLNGKILKIVNKYFPEEIPEEKKPNKKTAKSEDEAVALAIACAVAKSRAI